MKNKLLIAFVFGCIFGEGVGHPAYAHDNSKCFRLLQTIETKKSGETDSHYQLVTVTPNTFLSKQILSLDIIYGVMVSWGYAIRGENFWLPRKNARGVQVLKIENDNLYALLSFEQESFPMQGNWQVVWKKLHTFFLNQPFIWISQIVDKYFKITLVWEESPDPEACSRFVGSLPTKWKEDVYP